MKRKINHEELRNYIVLNPDKTLREISELFSISRVLTTKIIRIHNIPYIFKRKLRKNVSIVKTRKHVHKYDNKGLVYIIILLLMIIAGLIMYLVA
jgi:hypothetical protein